MAHLIDDLTGILPPSWQSAEVEIVDRQVLGGVVHSVSVRKLDGGRHVVKVAPRYVVESATQPPLSISGDKWRYPDRISAAQSHVALRVATFTSEESNHV
jgi:hypothetical protein